MAKKRTNFLDFLSHCKRNRFPLADEGKGPFNSFSLPGGCCQTRWGSLRCRPPATSRNKWSKPAPFQANFFPVRLEPAGRREVVSPERSSPWLKAEGSWVFAKGNFLVSVLTSTHTREGTQAASLGARGRERVLPGAGEEDRQGERLRRPRAGGSGRGRGGPRALTSSAIFQTFDPFRKARCSPAAAAGAAAARPRQPEAERSPARRQALTHLPRSDRLPSPPPGPRTAARAPPGPRRTPPAPLSRRLGPRPARPPPPQLPSAATHALREPLTLSPGPCSQRRPTRCAPSGSLLPAPRRSCAAAAPAGLHA